MDDKQLYQKIYDEEPWYGDAAVGHCPGVRLLPQYQHFLKSPVVDLGCGRGHTVHAIRELGLECEGYDMIELNNDMHVADITQPIAFTAETVVCMDVIEHILDGPLEGLFENFKKANRQVFSIHNGPSKYRGKGEKAGQDLHVNKKPFAEWANIIRGHGFEIVKTIKVKKVQQLFLTKS